MISLDDTHLICYHSQFSVICTFAKYKFDVFMQVMGKNYEATQDQLTSCQ